MNQRADMTDFFYLFRIPHRFTIDRDQLQQRYTVLQQQFHPDRYVASAKQQQQLAETMSAQINDGYRVLSQPLTRIQHLYQLFCTDSSEAMNTEKTAHDQSLLMHQMALNERIEEVNNEEEMQQIREEVQKEINGIEKEFDALTGSEEGTKQQCHVLAPLIEKYQFLTRVYQNTTM